jgi:hypothetical protein
LRRLDGCVEEVAAKGVLGSEGDGMQRPVDPTPAAIEIGDHRLDVGRIVDVELEDVALLR